ncbi:MAG TPA: hypothetical protein DDY98_05335 [Ruminococcaceae bacterium]|nr:hypothetical protein [Oscillospiraceae bacterium]
MDPIKVDFTGNGAKSNSVIIPPNKSGLKTIINIAGTLIAAAVAYYFYLPAFNFKSVEMYIFFGIVLAAYCVMVFITSGAIAAPEYSPYARKQSRIPIIIGGVLIVVVLIGFAVSSVFFRAKTYSNIIQVDDATFSEDISEADFKSVPLLDQDSAATLADKALSDLVDENLVSQFTVYPSYTQINLQKKPVRIATLKYSNIIKWFTNRKTGLPGYLIIDMTTQKVELKKVEGGIIYSNADHFNHLLKRRIRFQYPTALLGEAVFEVDESGKAYWICPILDKTIGLFGGTDVKGAILVDPTTGKCSDYTVEQLRTDASLQWIDRVYASDLLVEQYNYHGKYAGGFWNAVLGQKNVMITTSGYNYIALNDDVYMYTGITSVNASDNSITGFTLINQRTKEAKYYRVSGATENAAQNAAEGKVQQYKYTATFPLLLNIGDEPTYFMALKDDTQIVQQYAMVNVKQFTTLLTTGTSIDSCLESYTALLKSAGINTNINPDAVVTQTPDTPSTSAQAKVVSGTVTAVKTAVIGGNSMYYLKLDTDTYYSVSAAKFENVVIAGVGSSVEISYVETDSRIIPVTAFKLK